MRKKQCSKCKEIKPVADFGKRSASKDGLTSRCGDCIRTKAIQTRSSRPDDTRGYNLKQRFDMSIGDYNYIFLEQKGRCAICGQAEVVKDKKGKVKWLAVDHNHHTGEIRGLLCNGCNTGIGKLGDSVVTLESAIKYLKERGSYGE